MHDFVADLPADWLHRPAATGHPVYYGTGHRLFREYGTADRFWLLHRGAVTIDFCVPGRGDIVIELVGPRTLIGWSWLRMPYRWQFGAAVAEDIRAAEFDAAAVRNLIDEDPAFGGELTTRILASPPTTCRRPVSVSSSSPPPPSKRRSPVCPGSGRNAARLLIFPSQGPRPPSKRLTLLCLLIGRTTRTRPGLVLVVCPGGKQSKVVAGAASPDLDTVSKASTLPVRPRRCQ